MTGSEGILGALTFTTAGAGLAVKASALVTRPSLPDPATSAADMFFSANIFAAAGIAIPAALLELGDGAAAAGALAAGVGTATGAAPLPSLSILAMT